MGEEGKSPSAEQQLLGLIENGNEELGKPDGSGGHKPVSENASIANRHAPAFSMGVLKGRFVFWKETFKTLIRGRDMELTLNLVNNGLVAVICLLFVFMGYEILAQPKKFSVLSDLIPARKKREVKGALIPAAKELAYFLKSLDNRDIFKLRPKKPEPVEKVEKPGEEIEAKIKNIKLVGLSPSETEGESFVMLENTSTQTTFFLKEGETILGLKVVKITADEVVLSDGENARELK